MKKYKKRITISIDPDTLADMDEWAEYSKESRSHFIFTAICHYMWQLAQQQKKEQEEHK